MGKPYSRDLRERICGYIAAGHSRRATLPGVRRQCQHRALLHKSPDCRTSPIPGQTYPATSVTGMARAVKPFRTATLTWNSATLRSTSRAARRRLGSLTQCILVSTRLRRCQRSGPPLSRWWAGPSPSSPDRPAEASGCAQGLVARDCAGSVGLPRFGVLARRDDGCGPARAAMASWRHGRWRVSKAPSAVTLAIS